jgi:hypothetical protein
MPFQEIYSSINEIKYTGSTGLSCTVCQVKRSKLKDSNWFPITDKDAAMKGISVVISGLNKCRVLLDLSRHREMFEKEMSHLHKVF